MCSKVTGKQVKHRRQQQEEKPDYRCVLKVFFPCCYIVFFFFLFFVVHPFFAGSVQCAKGCSDGNNRDAGNGEEKVQNDEISNFGHNIEKFVVRAEIHKRLLFRGCLYSCFVLSTKSCTGSSFFIWELW